MLFKGIILTTIFYGNIAKSEIFELDIESKKNFIYFIIENTHLQKYQTLIVKDLVINSEKITPKISSIARVKKDSILKRLSYKTKNLFKKASI